MPRFKVLVGQVSKSSGAIWGTSTWVTGKDEEAAKELALTLAAKDTGLPLEDLFVSLAHRTTHLRPRQAPPLKRDESVCVHCGHVFLEYDLDDDGHCEDCR